MPKFSYTSVNGPLLPSHGRGRSSAKGKNKSRRSAAKLLSQALPALLIAIFLFVLVTLGALIGGYRMRSSLLKSSNDIKSYEIESSLSKSKPRLNPKLKKRLDALIEEATVVARKLDIITDFDAAIEKQKKSSHILQDWSHLLDNKDSSLLHESLYRSTRPHCTEESCGPRGKCNGSFCHCVAAVTGSRCGHSVLMAKSSSVEKASFLELGYFGRMLQGAYPVRSPSPSSLDLKSTFLRKKVQEKCAIIGTSSSVLFSHSSGSSIDGYPVLLRMNPRPWKSLEAYLGYRKGIAIVDKPFWETHSKYLVHTHDLVILVTDAVQSQMDQNSVGHTTKLYTIHPRFLSHIENIFGKSATASDVLFPTLALALNLCRSVTLFGASPVLMPASVPAMYYDVCKGEKVDATMSNKTIVWRQLKYFVELGLVKLGEPCIFECTGNQNGENKKCVSCRSQNGVQPNISLNC